MAENKRVNKEKKEDSSRKEVTVSRDIEHFEIGKILSAKRKERKLSQLDVNRKLRFYGYNLGRSAISSWETGTSLPNAEQFLALCELYGIEDINRTFLPGTEDSDPFRGLNEAGRARALDYIADLISSGNYLPGGENGDNVRRLPLYTISVSAGLGEYLDSESYTLCDAGPEVPASADFGVRIHGDSMTPLFRDGQTVWVRQTQALRDGDIGIFYLDGNAYCKKLQESRDGLFLLSLNSAYLPIPVNGDSTFRVFGKVVG